MDTRSEKSASDRLPQHERMHPGELRDDLEPDHMAGQNLARGSSEREQGLPTAYDVKQLHRALHDLPDDELKQVPILPTGARLQQGASYLDLAGERPEEFTALGGMVAGSGHCYVPKDQVPYTVWNRLLGRERPQRGTVNEADMGPNTG